MWRLEETRVSKQKITYPPLVIREKFDKFFCRLRISTYEHDTIRVKPSVKDSPPHPKNSIVSGDQNKVCIELSQTRSSIYNNNRKIDTNSSHGGS